MDYRSLSIPSIHNIAQAAPKSNMELNHGSLEHDCPLHVFCPVLAVGFQGLHSGDRWNGGMERLRPKAVQAYEEHLEWRKMSHVQELLKVTRQGRADMSRSCQRTGMFERSCGSWLH